MKRDFLKSAAGGAGGACRNGERERVPSAEAQLGARRDAKGECESSGDKRARRRCVAADKQGRAKDNHRDRDELN